MCPYIAFQYHYCTMNYPIHLRLGVPEVPIGDEVKR